MTELDKLETGNWQPSLTDFGTVVTDVDDIKQCMLIAMTTMKGQDRFRPSFGSFIYKYMDKPTAQAAPSVVKEILDAVGTWEQRVQITRITYTLNKQQIKFILSIVLVANSEKKELALYLDKANKPTIDNPNRAFSSGFSMAFS